MKNSLFMLFSGVGLAIFDLIGYFLLGQTHLNKISYFYGMSFTILIYLLQPFIMYKVLQMGGTVTILNLSWDCISSILVTILGLFYFKDKVNGLKMYGLAFSILAIFLFAIDDYQS